MTADPAAKPQRSDDYDARWGVPPNDVPPALRVREKHCCNPNGIWCNLSIGQQKDSDAPCERGYDR
jgi:hypothetical protein